MVIEFSSPPKDLSLVGYNDITKKTCLIPDARSKPLHLSRLKMHVVGMIEII